MNDGNYEYADDDGDGDDDIVVDNYRDLVVLVVVVVFAAWNYGVRYSAYSFDIKIKQINAFDWLHTKFHIDQDSQTKSND